MKHIVIIILAFLTYSNFQAQNQRAVIYLRNSDTLRGYARISLKNKIIFREKKELDKQRLDSKTVKKISINENGLTREYEYKLLRKKSGQAVPTLMTPVTLGKINLFRTTAQRFSHLGNSDFGMNNQNSFGFPSGTYFSIDQYYVGEDETDFVEHLTSTEFNIFGKSFRKTASEYFKDCPELVKRIKNRTYRKNDIEEIVTYYNEECN